MRGVPALPAMLMLAGAVLVAGCVGGPQPGSLPPTLTIDAADGVAVQNGMAVPTFDWQPRPRLDLDGPWRVERMAMDADLSLTHRDAALERIEELGEGRHLAEFDDGTWDPISVPGTLNEPPEEREVGGWYRLRFTPSADWGRSAVSLRFAAVNYLADVWLNGNWLGYHEGGYTPFAFDVTSALLPGEENVLAVRVDNPPWGTRTDIVPWGLGDWWNYGGITGPVWMEAAPPLHIVRADVVPHLDAADVTVVLRHAETDALATAEGPHTVVAEIFPVRITEDNVLNPDPRALMRPGVPPLAATAVEVNAPSVGDRSVVGLSFRFARASRWSPAFPALYALRVTLRTGELGDEPPEAPTDPREQAPPDTLWTTFGLRHVVVDANAPQVLLNGTPVMFRGVGLHDEVLVMRPDDTVETARRPDDAAVIRAQLADARRVGADLIRAGHTPANPLLLMLTDRLGFAVWEEIPLYHATPLTFEAALGRGVAQQMLREMALRDMNRPSVMFHGLANESTGESEREAAMAELHAVDRAIDGTRLTGQAAYAFMPEDPTHRPLDVAGFTFYYGVFYGDSVRGDTARALRTINRTHPDKPVLALEFGRWADTEADRARQQVIFEDTYAALEHYSAEEPEGFVSAATWWSLHDFATQWPGLQVERFGLIGPDGELRPAGEVAVETFHRPAGAGSLLRVESRAEAVPESEVAVADDWLLVTLLAYAVGVSIAMLVLMLVFMLRFGGRATSRVRAR